MYKIRMKYSLDNNNYMVDPHTIQLIYSIMWSYHILISEKRLIILVRHQHTFCIHTMTKSFIYDSSEVIPCCMLKSSIIKKKTSAKYWIEVPLIYINCPLPAWLQQLKSFHFQECPTEQRKEMIALVCVCIIDKWALKYF
jgi:hypothetical protein